MPYHVKMFSYVICQHPSCQKTAVSNYSKDTKTLSTHEYCFEHSPIASQIEEYIYEYIKSNDKIVGLNASGISFQNLDFTNKRFYGCNFYGC
ncbi:MAG TPA: hypothetical protein VLZ72_02120, partial [Flavobacterium sp.]|nr:hypothetical protein [Flavobacterium sp.]